jgi:hypothetical protein
MDAFKVPLLVRGRVIEENFQEYGGRHDQVRFLAPDVKQYLDILPLSKPSEMIDLHSLSTEDVLDFLDLLGKRLSFSSNEYLNDAFQLSVKTSSLGPEMLRYQYIEIAKLFNKDLCRGLIDRAVGIEHLDGWVENTVSEGVKVGIRAFGARSVHIAAGNAPVVSAMTVIRNALIRGDAIIKSPSNDPLTAAAIVHTMIDLAPEHPLTKHVSVAYWKGGDVDVEEKLFQPRNIERLVAWGGIASVRHAIGYIQPGLDFIPLDPKLSSSIIGRDAFDSEDTMRDVAQRIALDAGALNQQACVNARVVYVESGTDEAGIARATQLGEAVFAAMCALPEHVSTLAVNLNEELQDEIRSLRRGSEWHKVIGPAGRLGAVILSLEDEPVDFAAMLGNRVINIVPVDSVDVPISAVTAYTQTIGVYPESLKREIRDRLAVQGGQRIVTLGHAMSFEATLNGPQDAIEPMRRMCKWIVDENYEGLDSIEAAHKTAQSAA